MRGFCAILLRGEVLQHHYIAIEHYRSSIFHSIRLMSWLRLSCNIRITHRDAKTDHSIHLCISYCSSAFHPYLILLRAVGKLHIGIIASFHRSLIHPQAMQFIPSYDPFADCNNEQSMLGSVHCYDSDCKTTIPPHYLPHFPMHLT